MGKPKGKKLPRARGRNLDRLGLLYDLKRRGFWEHVPLLGNVFFRRRIMVAIFTKGTYSAADAQGR